MRTCRRQYKQLSNGGGILVPEGLTDYFPLDEGSYDALPIIANGLGTWNSLVGTNTATAQNGYSARNDPAFTTDRRGDINGATHFDGTDYLLLTNTITMNVGDTMCLWIDSSTISGTCYFMGETNAARGIRYSTDNKFLFYQKTGQSTSPAIVLRTWFHFAMIRRTTVLYDMYLNGVFFFTFNMTGAITPVWTRIGTRAASPLYWRGKLEELRFYNRTLSNTELLLLANDI